MNEPLIPLNKLARVLADPKRWKILQELAKGEALPIKEIANRIGRKPDMTSKHMAVIRDAGLVVTGYGHLYLLAPAFRPPAGATSIDLGHCSIHLG
jgi:DNA-binding transcriptional ArsR family regulator